MGEGDSRMTATCSKGWTARCACAKGKRCKCACGGENHGKAHKRQIEIDLGGLVGPGEPGRVVGTRYARAHTPDPSEPTRRMITAGTIGSATQCRGRLSGSKPDAADSTEASVSCTSGGGTSLRGVGRRVLCAKNSHDVAGVLTLRLRSTPISRAARLQLNGSTGAWCK